MIHRPSRPIGGLLTAILFGLWYIEVQISWWLRFIPCHRWMTTPQSWRGRWQPRGGCSVQIEDSLCRRLNHTSFKMFGCVFIAYVFVEFVGYKSSLCRCRYSGHGTYVAAADCALSMSIARRLQSMCCTVRSCSHSRNMLLA